MHLFITYSRQEVAQANALHKELAEAGHKPWLDIVDIPPGVPWPEEIRRAIDRADAFLLIASPWYCSSENVLRELHHALVQPKRILLLVTQNMKRNVRQTELAGSPWLDLRTRPVLAEYSHPPEFCSGLAESALDDCESPLYSLTQTALLAGLHGAGG